MKAFGINDSDQIFEIVKANSIDNGYETAEEINNVGIINPNHLYEIAKNCVQTGSKYCIHNFKKFIDDFKITSNQQIFEILKLLAEKNARGTAFSFKDYSAYLDQDQTMQIAKICFRQIPAFKMIHDFGITDQKQIFEIVKMLAYQKGADIASTIGQWGVKGENELFELAKICAQANLPSLGKYVCELIGNFGLSENESFHIFELCLQNCSSEYQRFKYFDKWKNSKISFNNLKISVDVERFKNLFTKEINPDEVSDFNFEQAKIDLLYYASEKFVGNLFDKIIEKIMENPDAYSKYQNILWLVNTMVIMNATKILHNTNSDPNLWLAKQEMLESIARFGKPNLRFQLSHCANAVASSENGRKAFEKLHSVQQNSNKSQANLQNLLCLFFASLVTQGVDTNSKIFTDKGNFRKEIGKKSSCFFIKENSQILIEMLILLVQDTHFSANEKESLLNRIISEIPKDMDIYHMTNEELQASYLRNVQSLVSIFEFKEAGQLKDTSKNLIQISEEILKAKFSCGNGNIENFASKYHQIFKESRNPFAIVTYAAKIHSLNDQEANACLGSYVTSTLEGPSAFREKRYDLTNNPHLQKINEFNPKLFKNWKSNLDPILLDELKFEENSTPQIGPTAKDWMQEKLITDKHLDMETLKLKFLQRYLQESDMEKLLDIEKMLLDAQIASLNNLKEINKTQESKLILSLKNSNNQIKSIDSKIFKESMKTNKDQFNEQKKNLQLKFDKQLNQLKIQFPILSHLITGAKSNDDILNIIEGCNEIQALTLSVKENISKFKLEVLCIQWIKGSEILQSSGINLNYNQIKSSEDKLKKCLLEIHEILKSSPFKNPEFANDIQSKINEKSVSMAIGNVVVVETDDPIDILLCGTEVDGSCQRVDGNADLNKGLLGYKMDGKIKILAIKSAEGPRGKINARCLLRLLWDGGKPVLFMERFYPDNITAISPKHAQALIYMAQKKAELLGVPLLTLKGNGKDYGKPLMALGGPSPWEYCDGFSGMTKGKYEINRAEFVKFVK